VEQVHLRADAAMIAPGRLLQPGEMLVELLLGEPAGAVDARQHGVLLIAAPIGPRHAGQLEGLRVEPTGRGEMRPAAQVQPVAASIHGDRLVGGKLHHPFRLESLPLPLEEVADLIARPHLAHQWLVAGDDAAHLLLDDGKVLLGERAALGGRREVVIETVLGGGAEGDLGAGEKILYRFGEDMGVIVADELERLLLVARRHQRQFGVLLERPVEISQLAVDARRHRRSGEAGPDRGGDVRRRRAGLDLADRAVGESDPEMPRHKPRM
jgi:hypothetical protein